MTYYAVRCMAVSQLLCSLAVNNPMYCYSHSHRHRKRKQKFSWQPQYPVYYYLKNYHSWLTILNKGVALLASTIKGMKKRKYSVKKTSHSWVNHCDMNRLCPALIFSLSLNFVSFCLCLSWKRSGPCGWRGLEQTPRRLCLAALGRSTLLSLRVYEGPIVKYCTHHWDSIKCVCCTKICGFWVKNCNAGILAQTYHWWKVPTLFSWYWKCVDQVLTYITTTENDFCINHV